MVTVNVGISERGHILKERKPELRVSLADSSPTRQKAGHAPLAKSYTPHT